jgi:integrase/recombinase XerD
VSKLGKAVAHYLALRRSLGFKLGRTETRLQQFLAFMEGKRTARITTALVLEFATEASQLDPRTKAHRLSVVRGFARHLAATDPTIEIPPLGLLPSGFKRAHPHLYSDEELRRLLAGAKTSYPPLSAVRSAVPALTGAKPSGLSEWTCSLPHSLWADLTS